MRVGNAILHEPTLFKGVRERERERERKILRMHISHVNLWESLIGVMLHASECERRRTSHSERQFVVVGCDRLGSVLEICLK